MNEETLDPVAEDAVRELADQLGATLALAIDAAASESLRRVEDELNHRIGQIDSATTRVVSIVDMIGAEMRSRASEALVGAIHNHLVPTLVKEGHNAAERVEQRLGPVLKNVEDRVVIAISGAEQHLRDRVDTNMAALTKNVTAHASALATQIEKARNGIELNAKRLSEAGERSNTKEIRDGVASVREQVTVAHNSIADDIRSRSARVTETISGQLASLRADLITKIETLAQEQLRREQEAAARIESILLSQDVVLRRIAVGVLAAVLLSILNIVLKS